MVVITPREIAGAGASVLECRSGGFEDCNGRGRSRKL